MTGRKDVVAKGWTKDGRANRKGSGCEEVKGRGVEKIMSQKQGNRESRRVRCMECEERGDQQREGRVWQMEIRRREE